MLHASLKIAALEAQAQGDLVAAGKLNGEADGIEADLEAAARFALERAEAEACFTRTGHHSATTGEWRDGAGLIAGMFTYHISRDGDPQLHVHIAIANLVQRAYGADGKYRRLDTRAGGARPGRPDGPRAARRRAPAEQGPAQAAPAAAEPGKGPAEGRPLWVSRCRPSRWRSGCAAADAPVASAG